MAVCANDSPRAFSSSVSKDCKWKVNAAPRLQIEEALAAHARSIGEDSCHIWKSNGEGQKTIQSSRDPFARHRYNVKAQCSSKALKGTHCRYVSLARNVVQTTGTQEVSGFAKGYRGASSGD